MKYVYFNPVDKQVMAEFNTPILSVQANWAAKGFELARVPDGMIVTRDYKIIALDGDMIATVMPHMNPVQSIPTPIQDEEDSDDQD